MVSRKTKILFISHLADVIAGAEKSQLSIVRACKDKGYDCHVILPEEGDFIGSLDALDIPHSIADNPWSVRVPDDGKDPDREEHIALHIANSMIALKTTIEEIAPDVVITNTIVAPWGMYIAKALGIPNILLIHEWIFREDEMIMEPESKEYLKQIDSHADFVIFNSKVTQENYREYFLHTPTSVMYPGTDITGETIEKHYRENKIGEKLSILIAGTIYENKNQIEAVRGIRRAIDRGTPIEEVLIIGWVVDPEYLDRLKAEIEECGLAGIIRVEDFTDEIFEVINRYNVLIMPSTSEGFGRVTLEAQLFGRVVIGSRVGGTVELVEDKTTGLLYDSGDVEGLAGTIKWVFENPGEAEKIAKQAMETQAEAFVKSDLTAPLDDAVSIIIEEKSNVTRDRAYDPIFALITKAAHEEGEAKKLSGEIEEIMGSSSFKTGHALLSPARRLKNLGKKD